jgi:hypothetical protein
MKTHFITLSATLALTLSVAAPALAEPLTTYQQAAVRQAETSDGDLRIGPATPGFQLTAEGDATSASFTVGRNWQGLGSTTTPGAANALSFKVSTPLNKNTQEGNFLTAAGRFSNGTSLGFSYTRMILPHPPLPGTAEEQEEAAGLMIAALHRLGLQDCLKPGSPKPCPSHDELVARGAVPKALVDQAFLDGAIWQWGVSAEVGRQTFGYRDPTTLADLSEHHTVFSAALNAGLRLRGDRAYVGGAVEYNNAREEGSKRILCRPTTTAGVTECFNSPYAAPTHDESTNLIGVARWRSSGDGAPYAVEIKAGYDAQAKVGGVVTSLYLVPDGDGALRGGLRLGWQSSDDDPATDDDNLTLGIFLGVPFSVF